MWTDAITASVLEDRAAPRKSSAVCSRFSSISITAGPFQKPLLFIMLSLSQRQRELEELTGASDHRLCVFMFEGSSGAPAHCT